MSEYKLGKNPCPKCREQGRDRAGNNFTWYGEGNGGFCWSCGFVILSDAERSARGLNEYEYDDKEIMTKEIITQEEIEKLKSYTGVKGKNCRGISDEVYSTYACRFKYSEETSEVEEVFYPYTEGYKAAGYKVRKLPKDFYSVGKIGKQSELFGQWKWKEASGKYVLVTAGEVDCLSAYMMLENYRRSRNSDFDPIPVVSSAIGESGSHKQLQLQYEWLNNFEKIIICYDNDAAGKEAVKKLVDVLPKGKMFVMKLSLKDANEYLTKGKEKQFIKLFYDAAPYSPDGIVGSSQLGEKIREAAKTPKIPLPPFMHKTQKLMAGGIPLGVIVNIGSASGTGKSTIVDECTYYWIFHSPHRVGVLSLESDAGQYGIKMLSRHVGKKIDLIESPEEKLAFLDLPDTIEKENELWKLPDGTDRWHLIDERDGGLDSVKELVMQLIISCGCKVIIIDPLQDLMDGLPNEEQAVFQKWMKGLVKSHGVTFICINHTRKTQQGGKQGSQGADLHEEDFLGSSSIYKSAAANMLFGRNKEAEDEVERNTTYMKMPKCRWTGATGIAGTYYYDNESHTMWDKDDWLNTRNVSF